MSNALYANNERIVSAMTALSSQMEDVTEPMKENYEKLTRSFDISDQVNKKLVDLNINLEIASDNVQDLAEQIETLNLAKILMKMPKRRLRSHHLLLMSYRN